MQWVHLKSCGFNINHTNYIKMLSDSIKILQIPVKHLADYIKIVQIPIKKHADCMKIVYIKFKS